MYYILFNPLSNNGACVEVLKKLEEQLQKEEKEFKSFDLVEISHDIPGFAAKLPAEVDLVIIGGDGTLHRFINATRNIKIPHKIYLYKAGTGNDFSREFKGQNMIDITDYIQNTPCFTQMDKCENRDELFLNCTGFGVDGEVCALVNNSNSNKKGIHYYKNALKTLKHFECYDLELIVDGVRHTYKRVWLATVMNGQYFGGGMKLSPTSNRLDEQMEVYIIHHVPLWKLLLIFPLIFIGKCMKFKQVGISKVIGKRFEFHASRGLVFQSDGEVTTDVRDFIAEYK